MTQKEILKAKILKRLHKRVEKQLEEDRKYTPPGYDNVYWKGVEWLDSP